MIKFERVTKRYRDGHIALNDVSFELTKGSMCFLTGNSGAGKSTLLKIILKMEQISAGIVTVAGKNISKLPQKDSARLRASIGMIFQNPLIIPHRTVFENVALPLHVSGLRSGDITPRVRAALDKVGLLQKEKCSPLNLSTGEQKRIGIARAIVNRPLILLADEPTQNLDATLSTEVMQLFADFNEVGTTILVATQDLSLIAQMSYPFLSLQSGQLIQGKIHG